MKNFPPSKKPAKNKRQKDLTNLATKGDVISIVNTAVTKSENNLRQEFKHGFNELRQEFKRDMTEMKEDLFFKLSDMMRKNTEAIISNLDERVDRKLNIRVMPTIEHLMSVTERLEDEGKIMGHQIDQHSEIIEQHSDILQRHGLS